MTTNISPLTTIDELIEKAARGFFDYIKPTILLVGEWDDHFEKIQGLFRWSEHITSAPSSFKYDQALVIINSRPLYKQLINRISDRTAVLVYDINQTIPADERTDTENKLVCYLKTVSPRFIRGHVRTLLQLRRWYIDTKNNYPLIIHDDCYKIIHTRMMVRLDDGQRIHIVTPDPCFFYYVFRSTVQLTHYDSVTYVPSPDKFHDLVDYAVNTTVILNVSSEKDFSSYQKFDIDKYSVLYTSSRDYKTIKTDQCYQISTIGTDLADFCLVSYYISLQVNLRDVDDQTRFVQLGDIKKLHASSAGYFEFVESLNNCFKNNSVRFRNIAPRILSVNYGNAPLNSLLTRFESATFNELFTQSNNALEHAELLSGITRSTLQAKAPKK